MNVEDIAHIKYKKGSINPSQLLVMRPSDLYDNWNLPENRMTDTRYPDFNKDFMMVSLKNFLIGANSVAKCVFYCNLCGVAFNFRTDLIGEHFQAVHHSKVIELSFLNNSIIRQIEGQVSKKIRLQFIAGKLLVKALEISLYLMNINGLTPIKSPDQEGPLESTLKRNISTDDTGHIQKKTRIESTRQDNAQPQSSTTASSKSSAITQAPNNSTSTSINHEQNSNQPTSGKQSLPIDQNTKAQEKVPVSNASSSSIVVSTASVSNVKSSESRNNEVKKSTNIQHNLKKNTKSTSISTSSDQSLDSSVYSKNASNSSDLESHGIISTVKNTNGIDPALKQSSEVDQLVNTLSKTFNQVILKTLQTKDLEYKQENDKNNQMQLNNSDSALLDFSTKFSDKIFHYIHSHDALALEKMKTMNEETLRKAEQASLNALAEKQREQNYQTETQTTELFSGMMKEKEIGIQNAIEYAIKKFEADLNNRYIKLIERDMQELFKISRYTTAKQEELNKFVEEKFYKIENDFNIKLSSQDSHSFVQTQNLISKFDELTNSFNAYETAVQKLIDKKLNDLKVELEDQINSSHESDNRLKLKELFEEFESSQGARIKDVITSIKGSTNLFQENATKKVNQLNQITQPFDKLENFTKEIEILSQTNKDLTEELKIQKENYSNLEDKFTKLEEIVSQLTTDIQIASVFPPNLSAQLSSTRKGSLKSEVHKMLNR